MISEFTLHTSGQGLYEITDQVAELVSEAHPEAELCTVFLRHTSASLTIQENADPSAKRDLEAWMKRLVPEHDELYTHTLEGPDDMPAHIKAALTQPSLGIPVRDGRMVLGTWQGIYVWEHRSADHSRTVIVQVR